MLRPSPTPIRSSTGSSTGVGAALTRRRGGETDYVSGVRVARYHTVWFEMHEDLLRLTGRERPE